MNEHDLINDMPDDRVLDRMSLGRMRERQRTHWDGRAEVPSHQGCAEKKCESMEAEALKPVSDALGDRIKANYEDRARHYLTRRTPVIIRVDGKAFHTYTRGMQRPFDSHIIYAMVMAATDVAQEAQGFKLAYVQSDEASFLLTDYDTLHTAAWFDYNKSKMETISASCMTAAFNAAMGTFRQGRTALFDARAFNIPEAEVANYFLWRAKDWERNSVSMYCRSFFSHKQMHGQGKADQHELLHSIGKNWTTDLRAVERNGTFLIRRGRDMTAIEDVQPNYAAIAALVAEALAPKDSPSPSTISE